jgi:hypothetical protein
MDGGREGGRKGGKEGNGWKTKVLVRGWCDGVYGRDKERRNLRERGSKGGREGERKGGREGGREEGREGGREEGREGGREGERGRERGREEVREGLRCAYLVIVNETLVINLSECLYRDHCERISLSIAFSLPHIPMESLPALPPSLPPSVPPSFLPFFPFEASLCSQECQSAP